MIREIKEFSSLLDLFERFPDEQSCIDQLEAIRWSGNVISPFDKDSTVYKCAGNKYRCKNSKKYFSVRTETIFGDTKLPLRTWFAAIYLVSAHKKGISSYQLARDLGITQKSAWFVLQRIRYAFDHESFKGKMDGVVEADETFVGGRNENRHKNKKKKGGQGGAGKIVVAGLVERGGNIRAKKVADRKAHTLKAYILENVQEGATISTDEWRGYNLIPKKKFTRITVNHANKDFVIGEAHTNTVEGFWSLFKRGIMGIYHHISPMHAQKYIDEFAFRYNTRKSTESGRFNLYLQNMCNRLTYKELITHGN